MNRTNGRKQFGMPYWYIENGLMKRTRDYFRNKDTERYNQFNYFHNEDDCIEEIERLKTNNNGLYSKS